jgi:hypothetical protein
VSDGNVICHASSMVRIEFKRSTVGRLLSQLSINRISTTKAYGLSVAELAKMLIYNAFIDLVHISPVLEVLLFSLL